jgi:hypothetical protein
MSRPVAYFHDVASNRYEITWDFQAQPVAVDAEMYWFIYNGGEP